MMDENRESDDEQQIKLKKPIWIEVGYPMNYSEGVAIFTYYKQVMPSISASSTWNTDL